MEIEKQWFRGEKSYLPFKKNNQIWSPVSERVDTWQPSWLVQWGFVSHRDYRLKNDWKMKAKIRAKTSQKRSKMAQNDQFSLDMLEGIITFECEHFQSQCNSHDFLLMLSLTLYAMGFCFCGMFMLFSALFNCKYTIFKYKY